MSIRIESVMSKCKILLFTLLNLPFLIHESMNGQFQQLFVMKWYPLSHLNSYFSDVSLSVAHP